MWRGYQLVATQWCLVALCLVLICIRLYVQWTTRHEHKKLWRELLLVFAWVMYVWYTVGTMLRDNTHYFDYFTNKAAMPPTTKDQMIEWNKIYALHCSFSWYLGIYACRAQMLLIYPDFCPRRLFPRIFYLIVFTWVVVIVGGLGVSIIYGALQCYPGPFSNLWSPTAHFCQTDHLRWGLVTAPFAVVSDVLVYVIPIIMVTQISALSRTQRLGVAAMFAIGFVNVASIVVEYIVILESMRSGSQTSDMIGIVMFVQAIQVPTAVMVLGIPPLRRLGRWKTLVAGPLVSMRRGKNISTTVESRMGDLERHDAAVEDINERDGGEGAGVLGDTEKDIHLAPTVSKASS